MTQTQLVSVTVGLATDDAYTCCWLMVMTTSRSWLSACTDPHGEVCWSASLRSRSECARLCLHVLVNQLMHHVEPHTLTWMACLFCESDSLTLRCSCVLFWVAITDFETFECCAHAGIEMCERDGHAAACSLIGVWRLVRLFEV